MRTESTVGEEQVSRPSGDQLRSARAAANRPPSSLDELFAYSRTILRQWRFVAFCTIASVSVTWFVTKFLVPPQYQAMALVRPDTSAEASLGLGNETGGFFSLFGIGQEEAKANEYISILHTFAFNRALIRDHHLFGEDSSGPTEHTVPRRSEWALSRILSGGLGASFDRRSGNIELTYVSGDPAEAVRILGFYIDELREKLRRQTIARTAVAVSSLEEEAAKTGDPLLRHDLYEVIARQVSQQKLAEVQADFAFSVLEPPIAPDEPFKPRVRLDCMVAGLLALLAASAIVVLYEMAQGFGTQTQSAARAAARRASSR